MCLPVAPHREPQQTAGAHVSLSVTQIDAAITAILTTGQSYTVDGVTYTRADLGRLQDLRREIQGEAANAGGRSLFDRALVGVMRR